MTFHSIAKTKKPADKRPWAFLCYLRRYFFVIQVLDGVFNAYMVCVLLFYGRIFIAYLPTVFYFQCVHTPDVGLQLRAAVWVRTVGAQKAHKKRAEGRGEVATRKGSGGGNHKRGGWTQGA